jgi:DNA uptake protein ComE-like DNA-binding protein
VKSFRKTFTALVGFDRRERRGTYILSLLLMILIIVRLTAFRPGRVPDVSGMQAAVAGGEPPVATAGNPPPEPVFFDPNRATYDELVRAGLTERQARTLVNYRSSGARFRRPEDITRVYGVDSATASLLIPYIIIEDTGSGGREERLSHPRVDRPEKASSVMAGQQAPLPDNYSSGLPEVPVDLNSCSASDLAGLPGIGAVLSERIIRYRRLLGGFVDTRQLREVYGLDSVVAGFVSAHVTLTFDSVRPLLLDSLTFGELARHPYIGFEGARAITRYRAITGTPLTLGNMVSCGVLTRGQAERLAPYVQPRPGTTGNDFEFISSKVLK